MTTVYVLRHGEPEDRTIFYGQRDVGLSPLGLAQVQAQAAFFGERPVSRILSSDLHRCVFGAKAVALATGAPITTHASLREMHLGLLEGVPMQDALARWPELADRSYSDMLDFAFPEGGESVRDVAQRIYPQVDAAIEAHEGDGALMLYVHNTVARLLLARAAGLGAEGYVRFEQGYAAMNRLSVPRHPEATAKARWGGASIVWCNRAAPLAAS